MGSGYNTLSAGQMRSGTGTLQRILEHSLKHSSKAVRSKKKDIHLAGSATWSGLCICYVD